MKRAGWCFRGFFECSAFLSISPQGLLGIIFAGAPASAVAIITWEDYRGSIGTGEIYAQRIDKDGNLGTTFYDELAVDFGSSGLWHYDTTWTRLATAPAEDIIAVDLY